MNCHVCQTNLPDGAICCYNCGISVGGAIRQVEPLPVFEGEQTTFVRPRDFDSPSEETTTEKERSFADFIKIALLVVLLVGGIVGGMAFISSREKTSTAQSPQKQEKSTVPQTTPTSTPRKTTPVPAVSPPLANSANRVPANIDPQENQPSGNYAVNSIPSRSQTNSPNLQPEQLQRGFEVALQFLKNEMLAAAAQKAKNKHPLSRLENCTQEVTQTFQSDSLQEYIGIYPCRLRGTMLGRDVFEIPGNVTGKIEHRYGSFFRSVSGSEISSDIKPNN